MSSMKSAVMKVMRMKTAMSLRNEWFLVKFNPKGGPRKVRPFGSQNVWVANCGLDEEIDVTWQKYAKLLQDKEHQRAVETVA